MVSDPIADLAHIRRLMDETRQSVHLSGSYFIIWGLAGGLGLFGTWASLTGLISLSPLAIWAVLMAAGSLANVVLVAREARKPVGMAAGKLIGAVWMSMGITTAIIIFIGVGSGSLAGQHAPALASAAVGGAVFLTGTLAGLQWLRNLAFGWWAGAAVMLIWPGFYVLLLLGAMLLLFYLVPGVILIRNKPQVQPGGAAGV